MSNKNELAVWSTAFVNNLPDSSFAFIESGGAKDSSGKTTPRSLRHLPYKDASGSVDHNHAANALARLDQTQGIPAGEKAAIKTKLQNALAKSNASADTLKRAFRVTKIELDANGALPTRIMLLQSGNWPNSMKGDFEITADDLAQVKDNFDKGIGFPSEDASTGLAVDFKHEYADKAAAWIKGLELDTTDPETTKLYANPVEWTDAGAKAVQSGEFKMISPSGYFGRKDGKLSAWPNPQNLKQKVKNVLDGAGLTNIPFLRGMSPIRASVNENFDKELDYDKVIFISDTKQTNEEPKMTLDSIKTKNASELSAEEKQFLLDNASELSDEERQKLGVKQAYSFDGEEENGKGSEDQLSEEDKALLAAVKSGDKKVIDKTELSAEQERMQKLEATAEKYETEKAAAVVEAHVKRGAIKQDATDFWTKSLLGATGDQRTELEAQLKALPDNELLSKEIGTAEDVNAGSTAREQLDVKAREKVAQAAKDGKELLYSDALKQVYRENKDLMTQDVQEQKTKAGALNAVGA